MAFVFALTGLAPFATAAPAPEFQAVSFRQELAERAPPDLRAFYAARGWQPLWLSPEGRGRPAASILLHEDQTAGIDGVKPGKLRAGELRKALDRMERGTPEYLARIELTASRVYVAYVKTLRGAPRAAMLYESEALAPIVPTTTAALQSAAAAGSLDDHLAAIGWMHPLYAPLRSALLNGDYSDDRRRQLATNLARVRALPAWPADRYVLVDAAGQRLWLYEQGRPVGSMRVFVGKPDNQTPMMAGFLRYAILNPYWNVPEDLIAGRIARNALDKGTRYLKVSGYQVLSGWENDAAEIDPSLIDWAAVAAGTRTVRVRQLPGGDNFMGRVKFMFPNAAGIYLYDTPEKI